MKHSLIFTSFFLIIFNISALSLVSQQDAEHAFFIKSIYDHSLGEGECDTWLQYLSDTIGGRLAGSEASLEAVHYTQKVLKSIDIVDTAWLQPCEVPLWDRGPQKEIVRIQYDGQQIELNALALGNSEGTGEGGVTGQVIEVNGLDTLELLGEAELKGKIVFFNRAMDPTKVRTFHAYGEAVDQRVYGAARASKYGAAAVLVRSMTTNKDDFPHTGVQLYGDSEPIPSIAISTNDADRLSTLLNSHTVEAYIENYAQMLEPVQSYNVIAEIRGSTHPDEIILVGGHLDSWDVGGGAHDDGAGCVHSIQVIHTLNALGYKPKRTIRCVMFMNEENGLGGGLAYAEASNAAGEFHLAAIESDAGGFTPRGFACSADAEVFKPYLANLQSFDKFLDPYDLFLKAGGGGADIGPLKSQKGLLIGLRPDSQRYFDFHHTEADVFANVNVRELKLGAAAMTSLVYLIDQFGL
ncbi:MAG: M20/M25/M40 family metallo-hydrolase [Saprospiraceae bacterium]|nr:M20/M25/M40 family metallo-hydrolase [Saprospiraceae bacterium]